MSSDEIPLVGDIGEEQGENSGDGVSDQNREAESCLGIQVLQNGVVVSNLESSAVRRSSEYDPGSSMSVESVRHRAGRTIRTEEQESGNRRYEYTKPGRMTMTLTVSISLIIAFAVMLTVVWMTQNPLVGTRYDQTFSLSRATHTKPKLTGPVYTPSRSLQEVVLQERVCGITSEGGLFIKDNKNDSSCRSVFNGNLEYDAKMVFPENKNGKCTEVEFYYPTFTKFCIYPNTTLLIKRELTFTMVLPRNILENGAVLLDFADFHKTIPVPCESALFGTRILGWSMCTTFWRTTGRGKCAFREKINGSDFHLRQDSRTERGWLFGRSVIIPEFQYLQEEIWRNGVISLRRLTHEDGMNIYRPVQRPGDASYVAIDDVTKYGDQFKLCTLNNHLFSIQKTFP